MKRGIFIAFEGIDGCGKSTQVWRLGKHLFDLSKYNSIVITREPWRNTNIRKILKEEEDPYSQAEKLTELFVKDRREHVRKLILDQLRKGNFVITDRFSFSTLAYQQAQGISVEKLLKMHKGIIIPDIIFLIDVPVKIAMKRIKKDSKRKVEQKFEKNKEFLEKLRKNFLKLANLDKHNVVVIDGTKSPEEIFEKQIKPKFDKFYENFY